MKAVDLYSLTDCQQVYAIKIGSQVIGHTRPGDLFISNLKINDAVSAGLVIEAITTPDLKDRECWLLTNTTDAQQTAVATDAGFGQLGAGVWFRNPHSILSTRSGDFGDRDFILTT